MTDYVDVIRAACEEYYRSGSALSAAEMAAEIMHKDGFPMHSPHHHYLVPAVLITAAAIAADLPEEEFSKRLRLAEKRGMKVPGAVCGEYGACGAGIDCGLFFSVWNGTTPMSAADLGQANSATAAALREIGRYPGPRCCKRVTFLALQAALPVIRAQLWIDLRDTPVTCEFFTANTGDCLKKECPFFPAGRKG